MSNSIKWVSPPLLQDALDHCSGCIAPCDLDENALTYFLHPSRSICWCWALIPVHGCSADRSQEERLQIWIWYDFGRVEKASLSIIERWNCCILSSAVFTSLPSIYFHGFSCCRLEHLVEFSWQLFFWWVVGRNTHFCIWFKVSVHTGMSPGRGEWNGRLTTWFRNVVSLK